MQIVNIHAAKTHLSQLLDAVQAGEEIIIARAGRPIAKISSLKPQKRTLGLMKGKMSISNDFDAPLPENILNNFEGK